MRPVAIVARGAVSALGTGERATFVGALGEAPRSAVADDAELARSLKRPRVARVAAAHLASAPASARAEALLGLAARELAARLDALLPAWRDLRVALCVGTSAGGMGSLERALSLRASEREIPSALARGALYDGPLGVLASTLGTRAPCVCLLGACVASTFALGLGARWLEAGRADLVLAGGYDALCELLASGFEALNATTSGEPSPFRTTRDGMALGEGAALVALMRADEAPESEGVLLGFGASADGTHVTAPDRQGGGLARAAESALADAGLAPSAIELVSAHATATPHNDAAEAAALRRVFQATSARVVVHPFKAVLGHTLGASGVLESLAALDAMRAGVLPAAAGKGPIEPAFPGSLLETNQAGPARRCLKLSAAFGGANAALVLGLEAPSSPRVAASARRVCLLHEGALVTEPDLELLAVHSALDELRRSRLDRASALALTAAAQALAVLGSTPAVEPPRIGVVVGTFAASLEANEVFDARRRERGAAAVEPRRFPATSPNLPAGWCAIAFGWRGPNVAVGGGPDAAAQALQVGYDLVFSGDAERVVVISCNDVGPATLDLCRAAGLPPPADGARASVLGNSLEGHLAERPELAHR